MTRGSLLLVGLLVVLVLAGVAIIGTRNVMLELRSVGGFRASSVSKWVASNCGEAVLTAAAKNPEGVMGFLPKNSNKLFMADLLSVDFYDATKGGSFGLEHSAFGSPNCESRFAEMASVEQIPGTVRSQNFVYKHYKIETYGRVGALAGQAAGTPDDVLRNAELKYVVQVYLGPKFVGGQQGGAE